MTEWQLHNGWRLLDAEDNEAARAKFSEIVAANPKNSEALVGLGKALARLGQPTEALEAFEKALNLNTENPEAHFGAGWAYREIGEQQNAEFHARKATALAPGVAKYHLLAAKCIRSGDLENILWHLEAANRLEDGRLDGQWRWGLVYYRVFAGFAYPVQRLLMVWAVLATLYSFTLSASGLQWWFLVASFPFFAVTIYNLIKRRYYRAIWSFGLYLLWAVSIYLFVEHLLNR